MFYHDSSTIYRKKKNKLPSLYNRKIHFQIALKLHTSDRKTVNRNTSRHDVSIFCYISLIIFYIKRKDSQKHKFTKTQLSFFFFFFANINNAIKLQITN